MSKYKPIYLLKLLHIIHYQLSVGGLLDIGLAYSQIAELLSDAIGNGLVEDEEDEGLRLTDSGLKMLDKLNKKVYPSNSQAWILPAEENRIQKIDKFDIYLPKKKK